MPLVPVRSQLIGLALPIAGLCLLSLAQVAIAADWHKEPVYLKNVAQNKSIGIQTSPHWPFEFRLYATIGRADIYENRGDPIAWSFRPGMAPETYTIVGKPTPKLPVAR